MLPDAAELDIDIGAYRRWLTDAAAACFAASTGPTIFAQTDRMHDGRWLSKPHIIGDVAPDGLLWHKIVLRRDVGATDLHRPTYTHLLAYGPGRPGHRTPDVVRTSPNPWQNGVPVAAADTVAAYLHDVGVDVILNPACGVGTFLAAANRRGLDAHGCDVDPDRVADARAIRVT